MASGKVRTLVGVGHIYERLEGDGVAWLVKQANERANHWSGRVPSELVTDVEQNFRGETVDLQVRRFADVGGSEIGCLGDAGEAFIDEKGRELRWELRPI